MTDAISLLEQDHKAVAALFDAFKKAAAAKDPERSNIVHKIVAELSAHIAIEEGIFYPAVSSEVPELGDEILESYEEHHVVSWLCAELLDMNVAEIRYDAKVTVLIENVVHHVAEEETQWFPKVKSALAADRLAALGAELEAAKADAPRTPQTKSMTRT